MAKRILTSRRMERLRRRRRRRRYWVKSFIVDWRNVF